MIDSPRCETCGKEVGKDRDAYCAGHGLSAEHAPPESIDEQKAMALIRAARKAYAGSLHGTPEQLYAVGEYVPPLTRYLELALAARPALAGRGQQKISEPTEGELVSLGECAVRGYLDFPAAKTWFSNWLAGRAS